MLPPMAPQSQHGRPAMQALKRSGLSGCSSTCVAESANPSWHCSKHKRNEYPMPKNSHSIPIPMSQDCLSRDSDPIGSSKTIKCFVSSSVVGVLVTLTLNQPIHLGTAMIFSLRSFPRLHKHNNPKSGLTAQFKKTWTERYPMAISLHTVSWYHVKTNPNYTIYKVKQILLRPNSHVQIEKSKQWASAFLDFPSNLVQVMCWL